MSVVVYELGFKKVASVVTLSGLHALKSLLVAGPFLWFSFSFFHPQSGQPPAQTNACLGPHACIFPKDQTVGIVRPIYIINMRMHEGSLKFVAFFFF